MGKIEENRSPDFSIEVSEEDLPLHCPPKRQGSWSMHPKVYLPIKEGATAKCPYCGNTFKLVKKNT